MLEQWHERAKLTLTSEAEILTMKAERSLRIAFTGDRHMNTRTVRLTRLSAGACATLIVAVSTWALVNATASPERDPFRFAAIMAANARVRIAQTVGAHGPHGDRSAEEARDYRLPDLLTPLPACLGRCS